MKCANCGADIDKNALVCPYCNAENELLAHKQHNDYITGLKRKTEKLDKELPQNAVKASTKLLVMLGAGVCGLVIIIFLAVFLISRLNGDNSLSKLEKHISKLEKYYDAGEYDKMYKYCEKYGDYSASYEKYMRVGMLYDNIDWRISALKSENEYIKSLELKPEDVATTLSYVFGELVTIKEYEDDGYAYDEEKGVLYIKEKYYEAIKEYMKLTDAEIEDTVNKVKNDNPDAYVEAAKLAISRIKGY